MPVLFYILCVFAMSPSILVTILAHEWNVDESLASQVFPSVRLKRNAEQRFTLDKFGAINTATPDSADGNLDEDFMNAVEVFDPEASSSHDSKGSSNKISSQKSTVEDSASSQMKGNATYVNYCCSPEELYDFATMQCVPSNVTTKTVFHDNTGAPVTGIHQVAVVGLPNCSFYHLSTSVNGNQDQFILKPDGGLVVGDLSDYSDASPFTVPYGKYCLVFPAYDVMESFVCFPEVDPTVENSQESFKRAVYPVCLLVSAGFLLLTLLAYCVVKELRADQLSKCFMCSVGMLACAQIIMVAGMWGRDDLMESTMCVIIASLSHFSFLSAFLWLNVICIMIFSSLWWSGLMSSNKMQVVRLRWKCLYSFGVAGFIAGLALLRHTLPAMQGSVLPAPHFGAVSCWFAKPSALAVYLFGPITILLAINLVCFCLSAYKLCTIIKHSDRTTTHFVQYLKLFLLMGVSWIFEVISFFVDDSGNSILSYAWIFFDFVNIMQGVLIFVVFVCRPSVLRLLTRALCGARCSSRCFAPVEEKDRNDTEVAPCNTVV